MNIASDTAEFTNGRPFVLPGEFETGGQDARRDLLDLSASIGNVTLAIQYENHKPLTTHRSRGSEWARVMEALWETFVALIALESENRDPDPKLSSILNDIAELSGEPEDDEYTFRPSNYARPNAERAMVRLRHALPKTLWSRLPRPRVFSDGTGGIVIQWNFNNRTINAGFPPSDARKNYIYYESGDTYKLADLTIPILSERLEWLIHE